MIQLEDSQAVARDSFVIFVDDGSRDKTWDVIASLHEKDPSLFRGVKLAHNRGHQNALFAGLMQALSMNVDAVVSMDADLQDDPNAVDGMVQEYRQGAEIVYGVRDNRDTDTAFKRGTAHAFYSLMKWLGTETVPDHADYRLMSRTALTALSQYKESNLFLRGLVPSLGFKTAKVYYKRGTRVAGESKYPLKKMVSFAVEGVTSFSTKPLSHDYRHRAVLCVYRNHHVDLHPCFCFLWACGCRLGLHYVLFVDFGWFYSASSWNYRRIYRENLHGGQSSTALYH